jgi:hypothetical protein
MYEIGGCFAGISYSDLQTGEFHGIATLDSGETVRLVIPESVKLSPKSRQL